MGSGASTALPSDESNQIKIEIEQLKKADESLTNAAIAANLVEKYPGITEEHVRLALEPPAQETPSQEPAAPAPAPAPVPTQTGSNLTKTTSAWENKIKKRNGPDPPALDTSQSQNSVPKPQASARGAAPKKKRQLRTIAKSVLVLQVINIYILLLYMKL